MHWIRGHIQNPAALGDTAHRIPVCPGTSVTAQVLDQGGNAINTPNSSNLTCDETGCSVTDIQETEKYISRSQDGTDTDRMTLILAKSDPSLSSWAAGRLWALDPGPSPGEPADAVYAVALPVNIR